jgi:hypothetical protein
VALMFYDLDIRHTCLWVPVHRPGFGLEVNLLTPVREWCEANLQSFRLVGSRHIGPNHFETKIRFSSEADMWQFKLRWFGIDNPRDL